MNKFGRASLKNLSSADHRFEELSRIVLKIKDHSIIKGHRGQVEQDKAYASGASELFWPNGKHNRFPSLAIDVQTYPRPDDKQDLREEQLYLLGLYKGIGYLMGIRIRTGADWDNDGEIADNGFDDFFHVQIDE